MPRRHLRKVRGEAKGKQEKALSGEATQRAYEMLMAGREQVMMCVMEVGLVGIGEVLEHARGLICGEPYERDERNHMARWGYKRGRAYVGGQQVAMDRPRVRDLREGEEVMLPAWKRLQDPREFDETVFGRMIRGISTRDYEGALMTTMDALGVSKSNVDRAFIRKATARWQEMQERDLSKLRVWAILIDGIHFRGEGVGICAIGYTVEGEKEPLGFWEGSTESTENASALLGDLERRGLKLTPDMLFGIDGGGGLTKSLENRLGKGKALICRCFLHKLRNLKKYLAPRYHREVRQRLYRIRDAVALEEAEREARSMLEWLQGINVSAHRSLQEAAPYLTTLQRAEVPAELRKHLYTTNSVESMFSTGPRKLMRNVKRWRGGSMQRQRYLAVGLWWAWQHFRKLNGYRKIAPWLAQRELAMKKRAG
jgi:transposase-like protein